MVAMSHDYSQLQLFDEMTLTLLKGKYLARQIGIQMEPLLWIPITKTLPLEDLICLVTVIDQMKPNQPPFILPSRYSVSKKCFEFRSGGGILASETVVAWTSLPLAYLPPG